MKEKVIIIGGGIGGLSTACLLGKAGYDVTVLEKNEQMGGRMSVLKENGYSFDMGPSWYLMPDIFEHFFHQLGEKVEDHLELIKLQPSYRIYFKDTPDTNGNNKQVDIYGDIEKDGKTFESFEKGSSEKLKEYLKLSEYQYNIAKKDFLYKNFDSFFDFFNKEMLLEGSKLSVFTKMNNYVSKFFKSEELQKIMQYTLVFLGSSPYNTPALYNIMSHIDFNMGVFYPQGGIGKITDALVRIGTKYGVHYRTNCEVKKILTQENKAVGVQLASGEKIGAPLVISNADMAHTEISLLPPKQRTYSEKYWKKKVFSPSAFIMYLGVDGKIDSFLHHTLMFSKDWKKNFADIFDKPTWPSDPSIYICSPSKTDKNVAPEGKENMFILVPIAPGLDYTQEQLEQYGEKILETVEKEMNVPNLRKRIEYKKYFCVKDFESRYNSYLGSALGLAHPLLQTAVFRPNNKSKKVKNLFFVGGDTTPGIGMPICLISADLVTQRILNKK